MIACAPLHGLVLAGGESRRMGRDKATLHYGGRTQLDAAFEIVSRHCEQAWISVRAAQAHDPVRAALPRIVDGVVGQGPIAGIAAAQAAHPDAAWLVVACDLPFLDDTTLDHLVATNSVFAVRFKTDSLLREFECSAKRETANVILPRLAAKDRIGHVVRGVFTDDWLATQSLLHPRGQRCLRGTGEFRGICID